MNEGPWRVVVISQVPAAAEGMAAIVRALGHEPVAHFAVRRRKPEEEVPPQFREFIGKIAIESPHELDLVFPATRDRVAPLLRAYEADLAVCFACPWLLPPAAIEAPRLGIVNGHPSLLPNYRGPSPVAWAIRSGEHEIGFTFHRMDARFDTGAILAQKAMPLDADESHDTMKPKFAEAIGELLPTVFERLARGEEGEPQGEGTYQSLFEDDYAWIDWNRSADEVQRQVSAWRFAFSLGERGPLAEIDGRTVRVLRVSLEPADGVRIECADRPVWIVETEPVEVAVSN